MKRVDLLVASLFELQINLLHACYGVGAVVSPTMSWDLSAAALLSLVGMISTPKLSPYSFAMPSALATSMSQRHMVLIWGSASCTAEIIVRPITPAPTRHAMSAQDCSTE